MGLRHTLTLYSVYLSLNRCLLEGPEWVDSGLSGRQVMMDEGIEKSRAEAGSVES